MYVKIYINNTFEFDDSIQFIDTRQFDDSVHFNSVTRSIVQRSAACMAHVSPRAAPWRIEWSCRIELTRRMELNRRMRYIQNIQNIQSIQYI